MTTRWETYPIQHSGGLVSNLAPLQQGTQLPGSASRLLNFEPSLEGGYRRILGFQKYDDETVPSYGEPVVQGSGQSGTTLEVSNIFESPSDGDTLTIDGVTGTYTIDGSGVSYNATSQVATITLTTSLASSPADQASVTFGDSGGYIKGITHLNGKVLVARDGSLWEGVGSGWSSVNTPSYSYTVNGGSQTGTSLAVNGPTSEGPVAGETFVIDGVEKVYTVTGDYAGGGSFSISPALDSSPADTATITFLSTPVTDSGKVRFSKYNFDGTEKLVGVDGEGYPFLYDGTTFRVNHGAPSDVIGSSFVTEFKNHLFFAKDNSLAFTAPFLDTDFTGGSGGGVVAFPFEITGIITFREQLIVFGVNEIHRLIGNTEADFQVQPITKNIGCPYPDSIREVGTDIAFAGPDGIRMLSATDRIGDFGIAVSSRPIQSEVQRVFNTYTYIEAIVLREKSQYRLLACKDSIQPMSTKGILGTLFTEQSSGSFAWAETQGFKAYTTFSEYIEELTSELLLFAHSDGYVYQMESGNSMDGGNINASFHTPYVTINDPRIRKTWYKLHTYVDSTGAVEGSVGLSFNFGRPGEIQPNSQIFSDTSSAVSFWGEGVWGEFTWGGNPQTTFESQVIGSSYSVAIKYEFNSINPPFSLDTSILEFASEDRQ